MKSKILQIVLVGIFMLALTCFKSNAVTVVHITGAADSTFTYCPLPVGDDLFVYGQATGYPAGDSVHVHIYFGDGTDTIFYSGIYNSNSFFAGAYHTYTTAGYFTAKYVVTGSDGVADSVVNQNQMAFGDTCGNISGMLYLDMNANCVYNAGTDSILRYFPVALYNGANLIDWAYTDSLGYYYFNPPIGFTYTVTPYVTNWGFSVTCPTSGNYVINLTSTSSGNDFGLTCLNGFDMTGEVWGWRFRPGYDGWIDVGAWNLRCQSTSGTVKLILDPLVTYTSTYWGPTPTVSGNGDTLTWNYANFSNNYFYYWWWNWYYTNEFWAGLNIHTSSSANLGDSVCFTLIVDPINGDVDATNNTIHYCRVVSNSWDPNYKEVMPRCVGVNGDIPVTQRLTYNLHFQNVGSDTAYNVKVYDTLDSHLDMLTFQPINADHNFRTEIVADHVVAFVFDHIMLPDSATNPITSQGQVSFSIKPKANTPDMTPIPNKAGIVFDFNLPVITNVTHNRINFALSVPELTKVSNLVSIFPNPAVNELNIVFNNQKASDVSLVDVLGNVVANYKQVKGNLVINTTKIASGIYTLVVNNNDASQREKVVILH